MGFAFSHLIFAWLIGKFFEFSFKKKLTKWSWFFLLFGAVFPDVDYLFSWILGRDIHRSITHSMFMVFLGFFIIYLGFVILRKKLDGAKFGLFFSLGILSHLVLDMLFGYPGIRLFWPLDYWFWFFGYIKHNVPVSLSETSKDLLIEKFKLAIVDMGLGVVWVGYLFFSGKLKEF